MKADTDMNRVAENIQSPRLPDLFLRMAKEHPAALAASDGLRSLTYEELAQQAQTFATDLRGAGVRPGEIVALACSRSVDFLAAILGTLLAEAVYMPLDISLPQARLEWMVENSQAVLIVGDAAGMEKLPNCAERMCLIGAHWFDGAHRPGPAYLGAAYCIYTSGSSGTPKGVLVPHSSVCQMIEYSLRSIAGVVPGAFQGLAASLWTSFGFDVSVFELFTPLSMGASVHIVPQAVRTDPQALLGWLIAQRIEFAYLPPFFMRKLADFTPSELQALHLNFLLVGVEPLKEAEMFRLQTLLPQLRIVNGYGPTEATVFCTSYKQVADLPRSMPIGQAIAGAAIYLLDEQLQAVPAGQQGEIFIGGDCLAYGYLGRPELSAELFLPDPFGRPGSRMYRSGDMAKLNAEGMLEFSGRNDNQIKLNGYRIELGEIDAALLRCEAVLHAVTVVKQNAIGSKRLIAYVVLRSGAQVDSNGLSTQLLQHLPEYMLPGQIMFLQQLPVNANGKLDRQALPEATAPLSANYMAPVSDMEKMLARIWCEALQLEHVGVLDGFRNLGGSSMQAIDISFRVSRELACRSRIPLPLGNLSIKEYATQVEQALQAALEVGADIQVQAETGPHPFSYAQEQVWFMEQMGEAWRAYRFHAKFKLSGALKIDCLRLAINQLIERHALLRTRFLHDNGVLRCELMPELKVALPLLDLSALPASEQDDAMAQALREELDCRFDIANPPLVQWLLIRLAEQEHILLQSEHHNVHDGQSMRILTGDLAVLYSAAAKGIDAQLPQIEGDYRSFCLEEKTWLATAEFARQRQLWVERLRHHTECPRLFSHRSPPPQRSFKGGQIRHTLNQEVLEQINACAAKFSVSRYAVMLAVFGLMCARHNGQKNFLIGGALANRLSHRYQWTVGMFVNMTPIPFEMAACASFPELLATLSQTIDFAVANSSVPIAEIVKGLQLTQRLKGEAPFNVSFSFHDSIPARFNFDGLDVMLEEGLGNGSAKFDLSVVGILGNHSAGKAIELAFGYNSDMFDQVAIEQLIGHYTQLLHAVLRNPHSRLEQLTCLTPQEQSLLDGWNSTATPWPEALCIHQLLEAQAACQPGATALRQADQQMSYGELNQRANRLAHGLIEMGAGPDVLIGVCLERSFEMVIALLAILKAGAAYLPLDVTYPQERMTYMLQDSHAAIVLTQTKQLPKLTGTQVQLLCLDQQHGLFSARTDNPVPRVQPQHLAYCLYTSGSTGRPKGVLLSHSAVILRLSWMQERYQLSASDHLLQKTSLGFDVSVWELFWTLGQGAQLTLPQQSDLQDPQRLADLLVDSGITFAHFTPALLEQILQQERFRNEHKLRYMVSGGDVLSPALFKQAYELMGENFHNRYGPTEAAINATCWCPTGPLQDGPVSIGQPLPNTRVYILDADLQFGTT